MSVNCESMSLKLNKENISTFLGQGLKDFVTTVPALKGEEGVINCPKICDIFGYSDHLKQACTTYGPRKLLIWPAKPQILLI